MRFSTDMLLLAAKCGGPPDWSGVHQHAALALNDWQAKAAGKELRRMEFKPLRQALTQRNE
ncbi:hypothetical protein [Tardiphaga sp. 709]|uniref:hypothetical protein n=1 Tax=Tardiphaga sp. 709 TaxID=3076039 RepID=UPI0028EE055D|nr:hypothetical protein [Tardiphaga sp. 709]WNV07401.1 hypothetical protein RSO67_17870 [Tardiphaga sp. 709]